MDAGLRQFQQQGLAAAITAWDHRLVLTVAEIQQASNSTALSNPDTGLLFTAIPLGTAGNDISIEYVDPGPNGLLNLDIQGHTIAITLATDPDGNVTTTANGVITLLTGNGLVTVGHSAINDDGTGLLMAMDPLPLEGGVDATLTLIGVQTDVEVDPEQIQQFGFNIKRVFSFLVNDPAILNTIKTGMQGVDYNGEPCRFLHHKRDFLGVTLYFGSVNR